MTFFDVSKAWVMLVPFDIPAARAAAEELARCIGALRGTGAGPTLEDAAGDAPAEGIPVILLNCMGGHAEGSGFTWRVGRDRVEIHGDSSRGLRGGVFDFLGALGFRWPDPRGEELPPFRADGIYGLEDDRRYAPSASGPAEWRRLVLGARDILEQGELLARWAARRGIDALVLSLRDDAPLPARLLGILRRRRREFLTAAEDYGLSVEAGGWDLSRLVPRSYFFIRRELFRMDSGRRRRDFNFCPTNPDTIRLLKREAERLFRSRPGTEVFHLWPDRDGEGTWCSCPNCRAFSPAEQSRIAINAAAAALTEAAPSASLSCYEEAGEDCGIPLRKNVFIAEKKARILPRDL